MFKYLARRCIPLILFAACGAASAASTCSATYSTRNDWATGFVIDIVLTNSGTSPVSNWQASWSYASPVALVNAPWGAQVSISGNQVITRDDGSHPSIAPGASVSYGLPVSFSASSKPAPGALVVTGAGCTELAAGSPGASTALYVDPQSAPALWANANPSDGRVTDIRNRLASQPIAAWFGDWSGDIGSAVSNYVGAAAARNQTPSLVAYNIPGRDCGQYSAGGANSLSGYQSWIHDFAAGIGGRSAIVILEPDALPQLDCLSADGQAGRLQVLNYAVTQFQTLAPNALVYMDIGHSNWLTPAVAAARLAAAGVAKARGFSLNVSNYRTDAESAAYGIAVSAALQQQGGAAKAFVVDTSRNGNGPLGSEWCDPAGRKIGVTPVRYGAGSQPEMSLWVKVPGAADGCAAAAGSFVPGLAYNLIYGY